MLLALALTVSSLGFSADAVPVVSPTAAVESDYARGLALGLKEGHRNTDWGCWAGSFFLPPLGIPAAYMFTPDGAPAESLATLSAKEPAGFVSGYSEGFLQARKRSRRRTAWGTTIGVLLAIVAINLSQSHK